MKSFFRHIDVSENDGCLHWVGKKDKSGYGMMGRRENGRLVMYMSHRYIYERAVGKIPEGYVLDHICRNKDCSNPAHLRCVTPRMNALENSVGVASKNAAKTHCARGHEFTPDNIKIEGLRWRRCKKCRTNQQRSYRETNREKIRAYDRAYRANNKMSGSQT